MTPNERVDSACVQLCALGFYAKPVYETDESYAFVDLNLHKTDTHLVWDDDYQEPRWRLVIRDHTAGFASLCDQRDEPTSDAYKALCYMLTEAEHNRDLRRDSRIQKLLAEVEDRL